MSIVPLSQSTVRALGSTQSLIDPASVVKDLIDNALDAGATAITIELSQNLIDIVQVKDNGTGICPADRPMVAKRHYTSKITNETELSRLGGQFLGFRGEALAHVAEMSQKLTVTTRIEGEPMGSCLAFGRDGTLLGQRPATHQVGSTVRAEHFLDSHPVRKKLVIKTRQKVLSKMHHICKAYALARPGIRMSFAILKTERPQEKWVLASRATDCMSEVATNVLGLSAVSTCHYYATKTQDVSISALLPNPGTDVAADRFVSLDGRPLSSQSSFCSMLLKAMKQHQGWSQAFGKSNAGFLCCDIATSFPCYDVNVEPAKDDVQLEDTAPLLSALGSMLDQAYPWQGALDEGQHAVAKYETEKTPTSIRTSVCDADVHVPISDHILSEEHSLDVEHDGRGRPTQRPDTLAYNPWTVAKINARMSPQRKVMPDIERSSNNSNASRLTGLVTPELSPVRREHKSLHPDLSQTLPEVSMSPNRVPARVRSSQMMDHFTPAPSLLTSTPLETTRRAVPYQGILAHTPRPTPSPKKSDTGGRGRFNKPFKLQKPRKDPERDAWFDIPQMHHDEEARKRQRLTTQRSQESLPFTQRDGKVAGQGTRSESRDIRAFMRQTQKASGIPAEGGVERPNKAISAAMSTTTRSALPRSPTKEGADGLPIIPGKESDRPVLNEIDANTRQRTASRTKSGLGRRTKSSMLPLERTPIDGYVQDLVLIMAQPAPSLAGLGSQRCGVEHPSATGAERGPKPCFTMLSEKETALVASGLSSLLSRIHGPIIGRESVLHDQILSELRAASFPSEEAEEMLL